jgi:hypothetical protein
VLCPNSVYQNLPYRKSIWEFDAKNYSGRDLRQTQDRSGYRPEETVMFVAQITGYNSTVCKDQECGAHTSATA